MSLPLDDSSLPSTVAFRKPAPRPILTLVNQSENAAGWTTSVTRVFDPSEGYCGRCPLAECHVTLGVCLVSVQEYVATEDGAELSTVDRAWLSIPEDDARARRRPGPPLLLRNETAD